jgi:Domain of unknown function (DUF1918)
VLAALVASRGLSRQLNPWDRLVHPARVQLALLDPQLRCHLGIVASNLLDEALRVLAADEGLDGVAERATIPL